MAEVPGRRRRKAGLWTRLLEQDVEPIAAIASGSWTVLSIAAILALGLYPADGWGGIAKLFFLVVAALVSSAVNLLLLWLAHSRGEDLGCKFALAGIAGSSALAALLIARELDWTPLRWLLPHP